MKKVVEWIIVAALVIAGVLVFAGVVGAAEPAEGTGVRDPFATMRMAAEVAMQRVANGGIIWEGHWVQSEYVPCILDHDAVWFEDGSAICDVSGMDGK